MEGDKMLNKISYMPVSLCIGCYKIPENAEVIGDKAVADEKTGNSGVLLRNKNTGFYTLFSSGSHRSVDQKEAARIAGTIR